MRRKPVHRRVRLGVETMTPSGQMALPAVHLIISYVKAGYNTPGGFRPVTTFALLRSLYSLVALNQLCLAGPRSSALLNSTRSPQKSRSLSPAPVFPVGCRSLCFSPLCLLSTSTSRSESFRTRNTGFYFSFFFGVRGQKALFGLELLCQVFSQFFDGLTSCFVILFRQNKGIIS